jgi:hypothetical protein
MDCYEKRSNYLMLNKNFDAIDNNKDSQLSMNEMKAYRKAHKAEGPKPA